MNFKLQGDQEYELAKSLYQDNLYSLQESFMEFDYPNIVSKLFILTTELERYQEGKHKFVIRENEVKIMIKQCQDALKNILEDICNLRNMVDFLKFAYELRKADTDDKYTENLLKDYVKVPVLLELIKANSWNQQFMVFDDNKIHVKLVKQGQVLYYNSNKNQDFTLGINREKHLKKKYHKQYLNFTLTRGCFLIQTLDRKKRLSADRPLYPQQNESNINRVDFLNPFLVEFRESTDLLNDKYH